MNIIQGDCKEKLKELPNESVDCIVTSPPYWGLRDYGVDNQLGTEKKITDYVNNLADVFDECKRVLKKTGTAWLNIGDSYATNGIYIGTYLKKHPQHKDLHTDNSTRYPQKLKGYRNKEENIKAKDLCLIPFRVALELQQRGWYVRSDIIWAKPNPMPESVRDRPTKSHEHIFLLSKSKNYYYDIDAIREPLAQSSIPRLNQDIKNQKGTTRANGGKKTNGNFKAVGNIKKGRNKRDVWKITTKPYKEAHFATFPKDLIEPCIKAGCPEDGVVLDPFAGSGTVGEVAKELQKDFILIELNPEYIKLIEDRLHKLL